MNCEYTEDCPNEPRWLVASIATMATLRMCDDCKEKAVERWPKREVKVL